MNLRKSLAVLAAGAALALLPLLPAAAQAAPQPGVAGSASVASADGCTFELISVRARNLYHDGSFDEVRLRLDDTWYPASNLWLTFTQNQTRLAGAFNNPTMGFLTTLDVRLSINRPVFNYPIDETFVCSPVTQDTRTFRNGNGSVIYDVTYRITVG